MIDEKQQIETDDTTETAKSIGQIVIGEIEKIGGILTADPLTQAEGDYNIAAGTLREEIKEDLVEEE